MNKTYVKIWLLLSVALLIFICISFAEALSWGDYTLKKGTFADVINGKNVNNDTVQHVDAETLLAEYEKKNKNQTDSAPKSILIFGDSMTYNLALRLSQYAQQNGHSFHAVNWDSSSTKTWADCDTLEYYIKKFNADFVFIVLGSNELYFKDPNYRRPQVEKIINKLGDIPYVWIGPPNWKKDNGFNDMLASVCRPGSFFLTGEMELKRRKDNIHPTQDASVIWLDSLVRWMPKSAHPILMDIPADSITPRKSDVIYLKPHNK